MFCFTSARKGHFRNVWVCVGVGGRRSHFSAQCNTLDGAHKQGTAPLNHVYSESSSSSAFPSGRAGTPLDIPPFVDRDIFLHFIPILQPFSAKAPTRCMQRHIVHQWGPSRRFRCEDDQRLLSACRKLLHPHPLCSPRATPFAHQRILWCIGGSNSTRCEFVCRHGGCLLTKRGRKQHRHRPKRTKTSNM